VSQQPAGAGNLVSDNLVVDGGRGAVSRWTDLPRVAYHGPVAALVDRVHDALPFVVEHLRTGEELLVISATRVDPQLRDELLAEGFGLSGAELADPRRDGELGRLWLSTSGSTGRPKRVGHTLASLTTVHGPQPPRRWLCPYSPGTYAWWQLVSLGLTSPGQDLVTLDAADLVGWARPATEHRVTAVSGTPTFWRQSLLAQAEELRAVPLAQVTLGGEPVDQSVLDQVRDLWPAARVSWIYASSEAGAAIVVHDGRAGFPESWLGRVAPGRPVLEVDGEELLIRSPHHGAGVDGVIRTGDRVERVGGRVLVTGRLDADEINVGGTKVSASGVRDVLLAHEHVQWARVTGRRAALVGQLVQATVVPTSGAPADGLVERLGAWCRERLPEPAVPRRFLVHDSIPVKETLKSDV
jgi:acyl-coenzyme A synthetase/AMP-(fatty) acid ligase